MPVFKPSHRKIRTLFMALGLCAALFMQDARAWQGNGQALVPGNMDCRWPSGWDCDPWVFGCDEPRCTLAEFVNPGEVNRVRTLSPGDMRLDLLTNPNPGSPPDYYYRDLCLNGAELGVDKFMTNSSKLLAEQAGIGAVSGSVYDEKYAGFMPVPRTPGASCMPSIDTPNIVTPTSGNEAFSYYLQTDNAPFFTKGRIDDRSKVPLKKDKLYGATTFLLGSMQGCPGWVYSDITLDSTLSSEQDVQKAAENWKKAAQRCYDYYIYARATHPEWTMERPGVSTDNPLSKDAPEGDPDRAIFGSCQPLMDGNAARTIGGSAFGGKPTENGRTTGKGFAPVLQYMNRADLDEAEYKPGDYQKKAFQKSFQGLSPAQAAPNFSNAMACVQRKDAGEVATQGWAMFNSTIRSAYTLISYIEGGYLYYPRGQVHHDDIPLDYNYVSKGIGKDGYCPNVEKINIPAKEDIFAPRNDYKITDRDYSAKTSRFVFKERLGNGMDLGYSDFTTRGDQINNPEVQCAIVPVDILEPRREAFDNCITQRINYNYFDWRKNNFLEFYRLKKSDWKPPCSTKFYEDDDVTTCPVRMSIQQCCRIIVKDVVPINQVKLRTCEGLRAKRKQAVGYTHISEAPQAGGKTVAAEAYDTAKSENDKLTAAQCDGTEPPEYFFKNHFRSFPPAGGGAALGGITPTVPGLGSTGAAGWTPPAVGSTAGESLANAYISSNPNLLPSEQQAIRNSMSQVTTATQTLGTGYYGQLVWQPYVDYYSSTLAASQERLSTVQAAQAAYNACVPTRGHSCPSPTMNYQREIQNAQATIAYSQRGLAGSQSALATSQGQIAQGSEQLNQAMNSANSIVNQANARAGGVVSTEQVQALDNLRGAAGGSYKGTHMPYMRWWDTGTSAGNANHGGSFINTLGSYDTVVGVGREERNSDDAVAVGKAANDTQPSKIGRIDGWEGLKGHQALTTRHFNLSCIGRYEKLFNAYGPERFVLTKTGGMYSSKQGYEEAWPLGWRGYINDTKGQAFPKVPMAPAGGTGISGLDNARKGDIVVFSMSGLKQIAYAFEDSAANPGQQGVARAYIENWDHGKFPTATGASRSMGSPTKRTIYKTSVPESIMKEVCKKKARALVPSPMGGGSCTTTMSETACLSSKCQPSCEDPDNIACMLPTGQWNSAEIYRPSEDANEARWCSRDVTIPGFNFTKTYQAVLPTAKADTVAQADASVVYQPQVSRVNTNIWSYCLNAGFDPPRIYRLGDYSGAGAGAKSDTTLCGPEWGTCSSSSPGRKCFPGGENCSN